MTKNEIRRKEKDELLVLCRQIYEELRAINIPVIMPKIVDYKNYKSPFGKCEIMTNPQYDGDDEDLKYFIRIYISSRVKENVKTVRSVMAHELLHTAENTHSHTGDWRVYVYLAEWKYHYGLLDYVSRVPEHSDDKRLFQCRRCGRYTSGLSSSSKWACPWCLKRLDEVREIDHSYEYGLSKKITPYYRGLIKDMIKKINYSTDGIPGFESEGDK